MTDEQQTICRELAEAMGLVEALYTINGGQSAFCKQGEKPHISNIFSNNFFEDWNATGALMEWWNEAFAGVQEMFICQPFYRTIDCHITEYDQVPTLPRKQVAQFIETGATAQEAITMAIYAAVKAIKVKE